MVASQPWLFILFNGYVLFGFARGLFVGLRPALLRKAVDRETT